MKFWNEQYFDRFHLKECPYPCKSTKINMGSKSNYGVPMMRFEFNTFIKTTKARFAYQELEFIAEFGGYVGLFLGISVFHLREAFQRLIHTLLPD